MFFKRTRRISCSVPKGVLDIHQLKELVQREQERADRRGIPVSLLRLFVHIDCQDGPTESNQSKLERTWLPINELSDQKPQFATYQKQTLKKICKSFRHRLRRTDDIGLVDERQLVVLLPDTDRDGAEIVAVDLIKIAADMNLCLHVELMTYPDVDDQDWDDQQSDVMSDNEETPVGRSSNQSEPSPSSPSITSAQSAVQMSAQMPSQMVAEPRISHVAPEAGADFSPRPKRVKGVHEQAVDEYRSLWETCFEKTTCFKIPNWKRALDFTAASLGLIATAPILAACAIGIRMTSKGPAIFCQTRDGLGGKPFTIYKFRTMRTGAEAEQLKLMSLNQQDGPAFKIDDDPRVTKIGKFLRRSCLDELPQLINVLRGDMSLVGPRPLPSHESRQCTNWQARRQTVRPGLTCYWQIHRANDIPFSDWMRMDLRYVEDMSIRTDAKLIFLTIASIVGFKPKFEPRDAASQSEASPLVVTAQQH